GLVTRAVHAAQLEEQRPELVAADHVEQERAHVRRLLLRAGGRGAGTAHERLAVDPAPLVVERGIEAEAADAPAGVRADGVAVLVVRRVAGRRRVRRAAAGGRGVEQAADRAGVGQVAPDRARRLAIGVNPVEQRLDVQALRGRELGADDDRVVLTAPGLE